MCVNTSKGLCVTISYFFWLLSVTGQKPRHSRRFPATESCAASSGCVPVVARPPLPLCSLPQTHMASHQNA